MEEYIFFTGIDQESILNEKEFDCKSSDEFVAFNSLGVHKKNIEYLKLSPDYSFKSQGLFIKKNKCETILFDMNKSDNYLHIDNLQEVDNFIEDIKFNGPDGSTVIFTNGNSLYIETFILNLLVSYKSFNKKTDRCIGVFCLDEEGYIKANKLGYKCCKIKSEKMRINECSDDNYYRRLSFTKILIIDHILSKNYNVLYIDPDMSFNINQYKDIDFIDNILKRKYTINYEFSIDNSIDSILNYDINIDNVLSGYMYKNNEMKTSIYMNSNLMLIKPTIYNKFLYKIYIPEFEKICVIPCGGDEMYINRFGRNDKHFSFWNESYYPNGKTLSKYKNICYMFHSNCVVGLTNKINFMKDCGGWYLNFIPSIMTLEKWQTTIKQDDRLIVQASIVDGSDSLTFHTIGMGYKYVNIYKENKIQIGEHKNLVFCAISDTTDSRRRKIYNRGVIVQTLKNNGIENKELEEIDYFTQLTTHKFTISPEGNGIDCHRHYEALIAGCIPIVEYSEIIKYKYGDCPILYTTNYSEITKEYLEKKYEEMKSKVYDFTRLFIDTYTKEEQELIKLRSDFWCLKLCNKKYY